MCRFAFSSLQRRGGFDSPDFLPFIHAANDITEIVFVALPRPGTPGKPAGSGGVRLDGEGKQEGENEGKGEKVRINKRQTAFIIIMYDYTENLTNNKEVKT